MLNYETYTASQIVLYANKSMINSDHYWDKLSQLPNVSSSLFNYRHYYYFALAQSKIYSSAAWIMFKITMG